jgi:hypothetical protein
VPVLLLAARRQRLGELDLRRKEAELAQREQAQEHIERVAADHRAHRCDSRTTRPSTRSPGRGSTALPCSVERDSANGAMFDGARFTGDALFGGVALSTARQGRMAPASADSCLSPKRPSSRASCSRTPR